MNIVVPPGPVHPSTTMSRAFYSYGKLCASHPWEVIIAFLTISMFLSSLEPIKPVHPLCDVTATNCIPEGQMEASELTLLIITITRCLAMFYVYHHFRSIASTGSKYLVGISALFTIFSSCFFCTGVINLLNWNISVINTAIPLFILLTDFPKATLLAKFALSSYNRDEVKENIGKGMSILGPSLTLDVLVETLAIGVGTLSGVERMEQISYLACLSVIVNYIILMTFFPACLSLTLELSHNQQNGRPVWQLSSLTKVLQMGDKVTPNPLIQRVKVIMSGGLMLVHTLSRFQVDRGTGGHSNRPESNSSGYNADGNYHYGRNHDPEYMPFTIRRWLMVGSEQILMLSLIALSIKYMLFDSPIMSEEEEDIVSSSSSSPSKCQNSCDHNLSSSIQSKSLSSSSTSPAVINRGSFIPMKMDNMTTMTLTSSPRRSKQHKKQGESSESSTRESTPTILITQLNNDSDTESAIEMHKMRGHHHHRDHHHRDHHHSHHRKQEDRRFFLGEDSSDSASETSGVDSELMDRTVQTDESSIFSGMYLMQFKNEPLRSPRSVDVLMHLLNSDDGVKQLTDEEILILLETKRLQSYRLEEALNDPLRGVHIRRKLLCKNDLRGHQLSPLPYLNYDYGKVMGACCENVVGFMPIPVGIAGPLLLDDKWFNVPMATTEGCLVASTNRGCRALTMGGGVQSRIIGDGMTRAPVVQFPSAVRAAEVMNWLEEACHFHILKEAFDSTSRFARLQRVKVRIASNLLYIRMVASTGDAMGMNMLSKGSEMTMKTLKDIFPDMVLIGISGNVCSDKKPSAINWIEGRGKSVVCEATVPHYVVRDVLKTNVDNLVELNIDKNLIGSALAGSIGGCNAHAANIVTGIFLATGQDPAQNVGSSNCMTLLRATGDRDNPDLYISCTMPSIEVGTIGGGTILPAQGACLDLLGIRGSCPEEPGRHARQLAQIVCATVMAAELSILSAIAAGHLVKSHMKHNRSSVNVSEPVTSSPSSSSNGLPSTLSPNHFSCSAPSSSCSSPGSNSLSLQ